MSRERFEHYVRDTARLGAPAAGSFSGAAGGAACGDLVRISLSVEKARIESVSFASEGCGATRAAAAAAAELADGAPPLEAALIGEDRIEAELGGLTPAKRHAAQLAADALHRALSVAAGSERTLAPAARSRVLVAMSGGVDSAVAALLERERGAEVAAVTLKLWSDPRTDGAKACCSPEAVLGARRLAHSLGIPHLTLDLEEEFRQRVVGSFVEGYAAGRTPNPCVLCNGEVRIAAMVRLAGRLGADTLVTGHYARIEDDGEGPLLAPAADPAKDQTYMLAKLPPELLGSLRFPLAALEKPRVREIAAEHGLPVAGRAESQDLCFLAGQGKREFLQHHGGLRDREGRLLDQRGRRIGRHRGHHHFTVGQRRGIGVAADEPLYVLATDAKANTVTVGTRVELGTRRVALRDAVLHREGARVDAVKLRYRSTPVAATLRGKPRPGSHPSLDLDLAEEVAAGAPGQLAALLSEGHVVGSGTIAAQAASASSFSSRA